MSRSSMNGVDDALYSHVDDLPVNGKAATNGRVEHDDEKDVDWGDKRPWPILDRAARYGLFGEIIDAIEDQTEAHPAALLYTLLVAFGNAIGPQAHAVVGDDHHPGRLFVALVGATSSGGKGTSFGAIRPLLRTADADWLTRAHVNGFVSGEAIIAHANGSHRMPDEALEKRIFVVEPEFARLLTVNSRDGSTASPIIRQAWDGVTLALRRSKDKMVAEGAHVSILGHVTPDELRAKLSTTEVAGGFANRFLFVCVKRARKLPSGGYVSPATIGELGRRLHEAMEFSRYCTTLKRSAGAEALWAEYYHAEPDRDGVVGEVTARANAQKLRLSVLYALADCRAQIGQEHVIAAEAAWRYCVDSAEYIFGSIIGDSTQDKLLTAAREAYPEGLTGTDQRDLFSRNLSEEKLAIARAALEKRALIRIEKAEPSSSAGRRTSFIFAVPYDENDKKRQNSANELFGRLSSFLSYARAENSEPPPLLESTVEAKAPEVFYDSRWDSESSAAASDTEISPAEFAPISQAESDALTARQRALWALISHIAGYKWGDPTLERVADAAIGQRISPFVWADPTLERVAEAAIRRGMMIVPDVDPAPEKAGATTTLPINDLIRRLLVVAAGCEATDGELEDRFASVFQRNAFDRFGSRIETVADLAKALASHDDEWVKTEAA